MGAGAGAGAGEDSLPEGSLLVGPHGSGGSDGSRPRTWAFPAPSTSESQVQLRPAKRRSAGQPGAGAASASAAAAAAAAAPSHGARAWSSQPWAAGELMGEAGESRLLARLLGGWPLLAAC